MEKSRPTGFKNSAGILFQNYQWESAPEYSSVRSIQLAYMGSFRVSGLVYLVSQLLRGPPTTLKRRSNFSRCSNCAVFLLCALDRGQNVEGPIDTPIQSAPKEKTPQNTLVVLALGESNSKAIDPRPKPHLLSVKTATVLCGVYYLGSSP